MLFIEFFHKASFNKSITWQASKCPHCHHHIQYSYNFTYRAPGHFQTGVKSSKIKIIQIGLIVNFCEFLNSPLEISCQFPLSVFFNGLLQHHKVRLRFPVRITCSYMLYIHVFGGSKMQAFICM